MTLDTILALFGAMTALAIIPSLSVLTVVARSAALGFNHGLATTVGIVSGDLVFIVLAISGLAAVSENNNSLFVVVKYFGGAYLIWLGIKLAQSRGKFAEIEVEPTSWFSSFLCGLLITLGDQKAILFYISFFPAFLDLSRVSVTDTTIVMIIATVAVGGVKLGYAYLAERVKSLLINRVHRKMNLVAGSVLISTGILLIVKT